MDKQSLLDKTAREPEDRLLLAKILDRYGQMERRSVPTATDFLSPREQALAAALLNAAGVRPASGGQEGYRFDGGSPDAERKLLVFLPDWCGEGGDVPGGPAFVRASFHGEESLSHRDLLGSLMGLGVVREKIGDILVSPHSADVVAAPSLTDFLRQSWVSAGRVKLTVTEITREEVLLPQVRVTPLRDTVSSLRLDAVVSAAFSLSRGKAAEAITGGRVSLDHTVCLKPDKPVGEGSTITCRGLGRAVVRECGRTSRKGRIILVMDRDG